MTDPQAEYRHDDYPDLEGPPAPARRRVARWQWIVGFVGSGLILLWGMHDVRMLAFMAGQQLGIAHGKCVSETQDLVQCQRKFPLKAYKSVW